MDWLLSIFTVLVNSGLGWTKGARWMWILHAVNAVVWIGYAISIKQYGLILCSAITIVIDTISAFNAKKA